VPYHPGGGVNLPTDIELADRRLTRSHGGELHQEADSNTPEFDHQPRRQDRGRSELPAHRRTRAHRARRLPFSGFADGFEFDVLDATKIILEEVVPVKPIGRLVLDRVVDNLFAETEQVAFCTQNIVAGIDFTNDPLLQGRNFSYLDIQLKRLGSPNFQELPVNEPKGCPFHNFQQDGRWLEADENIDGDPSVLFDAVALLVTAKDAEKLVVAYKQAEAKSEAMEAKISLRYSAAAVKNR
jgi:hypothetical protein